MRLVPQSQRKEWAHQISNPSHKNCNLLDKKLTIVPFNCLYNMVELSKQPNKTNKLSVGLI